MRAASTLNLRAVAKGLERAIGAPVRAVSLLHSSGVAAAELGGEPACLLEPALSSWLGENSQAEAVALPFFFGPSAALTDYVPERLEALAGKFPQNKIRLASWLVHPEEPDTRIAEALSEAVRLTITQHVLARPKVVLVDHGSPQQRVASVRNHLGAQVTRLLGEEIAVLDVASMERRAGPEYAFNDPLLATRLTMEPFDVGDVVVALQFLSPGRHAGAAGDIAQICGAARAERPGLRTWMTETIGADGRVIDVLAQRYREALGRR